MSFKPWGILFLKWSPQQRKTLWFLHFYETMEREAVGRETLGEPGWISRPSTQPSLAFEKEKHINVWITRQQGGQALMTNQIRLTESLSANSSQMAGDCLLTWGCFSFQKSYLAVKKELVSSAVRLLSDRWLMGHQRGSLVSFRGHSKVQLHSHTQDFSCFLVCFL